MYRPLLLALLAGAALSAFAADAPPGPSRVVVSLYKSGVVPLERPANRISVGNPGIADILVIRSRELYVVGKALGNTNVLVWDEAGRVFAAYDVEVTHDLDSLRDKLHALLPGEPIAVQSAQEQLILSGQVSSPARMDAARGLAEGFLPECVRATSDAPGTPAGAGKAGAGSGSCKKGQVVNLMQVGGANQVMLKVTVAEMARSVVKRLDSNLNFMQFGSRLSGGAVNGGASFPAIGPNGEFPTDILTPTLGAAGAPVVSPNPVGAPQQIFFPSTPTIDAAGVFLSYLTGDYFLQAVLDISKRNGLARILSEPTLTTLTGQQAQFLSGGEFPIPVPQGGLSGATTIEFKEFGVALKFLPTVLDSGRINLNINVAVSELSTDNAVAIRGTGTTSTFVIPAVTKRSAVSTVELGDGQTMGIAGLINENMREFVSKLPGLGDLPLIGALFRSQEYLSGETELVIFVTPHLARPMQAKDLRLPTDTFVPPSDLEFYLLGSMERTRERRTAPHAAMREEAPPATFGHDIQQGH